MKIASVIAIPGCVVILMAILCVVQMFYVAFSEHSGELLVICMRVIQKQQIEYIKIFFY